MRILKNLIKKEKIKNNKFISKSNILNSNIGEISKSNIPNTKQ